MTGSPAVKEKGTCKVVGRLIKKLIGKEVKVGEMKCPMEIGVVTGKINS